MFFEGLRSERQLVATASLHLAHHWYLGYALDEPLPDHSTLTKIRQHLGVAVFRRFFEHVVELCQAAGLVRGQELFFDATRVRANAAVTYAGASITGTAARMFSAKPTRVPAGPRARIAWTARPCPSTAWCRTWLSSPSGSLRPGAAPRCTVCPPPTCTSSPW